MRTGILNLFCYRTIKYDELKICCPLFFLSFSSSQQHGRGQKEHNLTPDNYIRDSQTKDRFKLFREGITVGGRGEETSHISTTKRFLFSLSRERCERVHGMRRLPLVHLYPNYSPILIDRCPSSSNIIKAWEAVSAPAPALLALRVGRRAQQRRRRRALPT